MPLALYFLVALGCAGLVIFLYGHQGMAVAAPVLIYVASLSLISLSVKFVLVANHFPYPKFLTAIHFVSGAVVSGGTLAHRCLIRGQTIAVPTTQEMLYMILPMAMALVISVCAANTALLYSDASFIEILSSANCLLTIGVVAALGMPLKSSLMAPAMLVVAGCVLASVGELEFSFVGAMLCFTACLFRSIKVSVLQKMLTGDLKEKYDPVSLLFWISGPCFLSMLCLSVATDEGTMPIRRLLEADLQGRNRLHMAVMLSCGNALLVNLSQLQITKDLGAVGGQLAAQVKMVLVVLGGAALFHEKITWLEALGFTMTLIGVYWFSLTEAGASRGQSDKEPAFEGTVARGKSEPVAPVTGKMQFMRL